MEMRTRLAVLAAAGALVIGAAPATAQQKQTPPADVTEASIAKGKEIFGGTGMCYACHGSEAKGAVGPNLTDDEWIHSKGTYEEIVKQVLHGVTAEESKSKVPMPPKGGSSISDEDVKAVSAYVWSLSRKAAAGS